MKKLLLILFIISGYAQITNYIESNHRVYEFLSRLYIQGVINNYDEFEIPKSKNDVFGYFRQAEKNIEIMNTLDRETLAEFISEFALDYRTDSSSVVSLFPELRLKNILENKNNYLFYSYDTSGTSFFLSAIANVNVLYNKNSKEAKNSILARVGGAFKGNYKKNFGFYIEGTNGKYWGNKELTFEIPELRYNYKYASGDDVTFAGYFDESRGYLLYETEAVKIKLGRDNKLFGYGALKTIIAPANSILDNFTFNLDYKFFHYSYSLNKILSRSFADGRPKTNDKYFAYHRMSFDLGKNNRLSFGEIIVYANRGIDLSYINPFGFYKNLEHSNQDRDNAMLFFDYETRPVNNLRLYGMFLIDDIDFSKLGNGWYGNKTLINAGADLFVNLSGQPVTFSGQFIRIEPYVYSHHILENNFSHNGFSMIDPLHPNSAVTDIRAKIPLTALINADIGFTYQIHGANIYSDGKLTGNYGGNSLEGFRNGDREHIKFLDGKKEFYREFYLDINAYVMKNYRMGILLKYRNGNINYLSYDDIFANISFGIRL